MNERSNAAHDLEGVTLQSGWHVIEKINKPKGHSGSYFSACYLVEKEGETCFLKAFDFSKFSSGFAQNGENVSVIDLMGDMINAFRFERDLSLKCQEGHVTKVSFVRDSGEESVQGYFIPIVPYLVFDLADGDIRGKLDFSSNLDNAWKLRSLHHVCVGLKQLHTIDVSHQDIKPSNILVFEDDESKIADLGRSICKDLSAPHDGMAFSGQVSYSPPEILYQYYSESWTTRSFGTDCYLFGNLIVFYFSGVSFNALLKKYLPDSVSWENWQGDNISEVKDYLVNAYTSSLDEFETNIDDKFLAKEVKKIVGYLCHPLPEERGHPKNIRSSGSNYSLDRFISILDALSRKAKLNILTGKNG